MTRRLVWLALAATLMLFGANLALGSALLAERPEFDIALLVADTSAPEVQTFDFRPRLVDTSEISQTIIVTTSLADFGSGVDGVRGFQVEFEHVSGQAPPLQFNFYHGRAGEPDALIDGDEEFGLWQSEALLPRHSKSGEWRLDYMFVVDKMGNYRILRYNDMIQNDPPFPASFEVKDTYTVMLPLAIKR